MSLLEKTNMRGKRELLWWLGIPVLLLFWIFGPYWIWNLVHHVTPFWRVKLIGDIIFDTYFYLEWLGQAVSNIPFGGHLGWFASPLRWLAAALPASLRIDELWLVSRWISSVAFFYIGPWCFSQWTNLSRWQSRLFTLAFWASLLMVLGQRPGVFSWYWPLCVFGFTAIVKTERALDNNSIVKAISWSIAAVLASSIYNWFLMTIVVWLLVIWSVWFILKYPLAFRIVSSIGILLTPFFGWVATKWLFQPENLIHFQLYERHGLAYTRLPMIGNSLVAAFGWLSLIASSAVPKQWAGYFPAELKTLFVGFLVSFLLWIQSPFTSVYLHNDHFRSPIVLLSWFGLAIVWSLVQNRTDFELASKKHWFWLLNLGVLGLALYFIVSILVQPYAFNNDDLNVLHLSHWFVLFLAVSLLLMTRTSTRPIKVKYFWGILLIGSFLSGGIVQFVDYRREFGRREDLLRQEYLVAWVNANVPKHEFLCADPNTAQFISAHAARRVYPSLHTILLPEFESEHVRRLSILGSFYNYKAANQTEYYESAAKGYRWTACVQFSIPVKILRLFEVSDQALNKLMGCQKKIMEENWDKVETANQARNKEDRDLLEVCKKIIVPDSERDYWKIPSAYHEVRLRDGLSVWSSD